MVLCDTDLGKWFCDLPFLLNFFVDFFFILWMVWYSIGIQRIFLCYYFWFISFYRSLTIDHCYVTSRCVNLFESEIQNIICNRTWVIIDRNKLDLFLSPFFWALWFHVYGLNTPQWPTNIQILLKNRNWKQKTENRNRDRHTPTHIVKIDSYDVHIQSD